MVYPEPVRVPSNPISPHPGPLSSPPILIRQVYFAQSTGQTGLLLICRTKLLLLFLEKAQRPLSEREAEGPTQQITDFCKSI